MILKLNLLPSGEKIPYIIKALKGIGLCGGR
jgi:hypothetical protein